MADWSNLPQDLVVSMAKRVVSFEDFTSFGAVCKSWSLAAIKENFTRTHQVPWLMLPEKEGTTIREFYDLKKDKIYKLDLPQTTDKCCFSSLGWIMTQSDESLKVSLLHPLNHNQQIIELPQVKTFKVYQRQRPVLRQFFGDFTITKFVLSSSPSFTSDYTVLVNSLNRLAFWRVGDHHWTIVDDQEAKSGLYLDITYYKGQFYVVDEFRNVLVCEIKHSKQPKARVVVPSIPKELVPYYPLDEQQYLVESAGALLAVFRFFQETTRFRVFQVPLSNGTWSTDSEVKNLGRITLFVGYNSSFSVEASNYPGCKANCIYFTNHLPTSGRKGEEHKKMGIFNMEDGKVEPLLVKSPNFQTPHLWVETSF